MQILDYVPGAEGTIGVRVRMQRRKAGLRLRDVADKTGLSVGFLSDMERGKRDPRPDTLWRILAAIGLSERHIAMHVSWAIYERSGLSESEYRMFAELEQSNA